MDGVLDTSIYSSVPPGPHWLFWRTRAEGRSWRPWPSGATWPGPWGEGPPWTSWPCWGTWKAWYPWAPRPGWECGRGRETRREGEPGWDGRGGGLRRSLTPHGHSPHLAICTSGRTGRERRTWRTGELAGALPGGTAYGLCWGGHPFPSFLQGRDGPPGLPGPPGPPGPKVITPALPKPVTAVTKRPPLA